jgi:hypothetical protein
LESKPQQKEEKKKKREKEMKKRKEKEKSKIGGPATKMLFFQMVPKSFLSVLIHSNRC